MEHAHEFLGNLSELTVIVVDLMAVAIVLAGSAIAFVQGARWLLSPAYASRTTIRIVWIRYARWLVAALTFQLAADIAETVIAPSWEDVGKLGAIALIRTFLNFFLERDLREMREAESEAGRSSGE